MQIYDPAKAHASLRIRLPVDHRDRGNTPRYIHTSSKSQALIWSLVLASQGIPHKIVHLDSGYLLMVKDDHHGHARCQIDRYERENHLKKSCPPHQRTTKNSYKETIHITVWLTLLFSLTFLPSVRQTLFEAGCADAGAIISGQWWRAVTALTLHENAIHLLGNMIFGGIIMIGVCEELGDGAGWLFTLVSGMAGNLINAWAHQGNHISIGASTAVFGAVGILTVTRALSWSQSGFRKIITPVGAGLALLGFMGSSGQRTDLGAHFFGFTSGVVLGILFQKMGKLSTLFTRDSAQKFMGLAAALLVIFSWIVAIIKGRPVL